MGETEVSAGFRTIDTPTSFRVDQIRPLMGKYRPDSAELFLAGALIEACRRRCVGVFLA